MKLSGLEDIIKRDVVFSGFTPMMFDRYPGDNKTELPVEQKMYFLPGTTTPCIPAMNLSSFLSAKNTDSLAKLVGGKYYKKLANALLSYVQFTPMMIPICRDGEPIVFNGFVNDRDEEAKIYVDRRVARLDKGVPNPKVRPVIELPWSIAFTLSIFKNDEFDETFLQSALVKGGRAIGLGTYRGVFGKFVIEKWE